MNNSEVEISAFDIKRLSIKNLSKKYGITEYDAKVIKEALEEK